MPKILVSKTFSFFYIYFVLLLTNGTTYQEMDEARTIAGVSCVGLYYYGAMYLDAKYSRWISTDPALGEYIPKAPINDEARKHNQNLPGMGVIFNHINCNLYAYGANNPVRYIDPTGEFAVAIPLIVIGAEELGKALIAAVCTYITYQALKAEAKIISQAIADSKSRIQEKTPEEHLMYHYTTVPLLNEFHIT